MKTPVFRHINEIFKCTWSTLTVWLFAYSMAFPFQANILERIFKLMHAPCRSNSWTYQFENPLYQSYYMFFEVKILRYNTIHISVIITNLDETIRLSYCRLLQAFQWYVSLDITDIEYVFFSLHYSLFVEKIGKMWCVRMFASLNWLFVTVWDKGRLLFIQWRGYKNWRHNERG